jgi:hypothetical protein
MRHSVYVARGLFTVLIDIKRCCRVSARKEQGQKYKPFHSGWNSTKGSLALGSRDSRPDQGHIVQLQIHERLRSRCWWIS